MSANTDSESQSSDKPSSPIREDPEDPSRDNNIIRDDDEGDTKDIDVTSVTSAPSEPASDEEEDEEEYFKPIKRLCMAPVRNQAHGHHHQQLQQHPPPPPQVSLRPLSPKPTSSRPLSSFFIKDILSHKPVISSRWPLPITSSSSASSGGSSTEGRGIVRPWDLETSSAPPRRRPRSADDDSRSERSESDSPESPAASNQNTSPLDALFEMTSKAFEGLDAGEKSSDSARDHLSMFSNRQQPKKKRKSRTAFTNHQIFELEKRFLYQKYLSPADRDEIAQSLGLTNAQVITWFQNRRAKLKRDMEELKKDVESTKVQGMHRSIIENIQDLSLLKKNKDGKVICSVLP